MKKFPTTGTGISRVGSWTSAALEAEGAGGAVVPLDIFLKMAGEHPTFKERYRDASSPVRSAK